MQAPSRPVYADIALRSQLRQRLLSLPFDGFARVVARLLRELGYESIRSAGRRSYRGRNQHSGGAFAGFDLAASLPAPDIAGGPARPVIVSLKQYPPATRVWQKQLDGLRGAALRVGASEALLITTSSFSPSVSEAQGSAAPVNAAAASLLPGRSAGDLVAPVWLVDGEALLSLLIANGIGVTEGTQDDVFGGDVEDIGGSAAVLDEGFFARVRAASRGNGPGDRFRASGGATKGKTVTIDLSPRQ